MEMHTSPNRGDLIMSDTSENKGRTLIFVYNADSGLLNTIVDYAHKITSPQTYPCNLCAITFGNLGMKSEWKNFVESLDINVEFLHRDEFTEKYKIQGKFPSAFMKNEELILFLNQKEMNALKSLDDLIELVRENL